MREYALVLLVTAAVTYLLTPLVRRIAIATRAIHEPRARDTHTEPTPLLGGLAMYGGLVAGLLLASRLSFVQDPFRTAGSRSEAGLLLAGGLVVLIGFADDRWGLSAISKLAGQVAAAGILVWSGQALPWLPLPNGGVFSLEPDLSVTLTILLVVVTINAINFIDGLDGLAAGIVAVAALSFLAYSYTLIRTLHSTSQSLPAVASALLAGMCIGFLPHNFYPARIFMGDIGAMLLGLLLAYGPISSTDSLDPALLVNYAQNHALDRFPTFLPLLVPAAIFIIPYADLMFAVIRRTRAGKPIMAADRQHLHHRLLNIGHSYRQSVLIMYLWAALFSVAVVSLSIVRSPSVVFFAATLVAVLALLPATMPRLRPWRSVARDSAARDGPAARVPASGPPSPVTAPPVPDVPRHPAATLSAPPASGAANSATQSGHASRSGDSTLSGHSTPSGDATQPDHATTALPADPLPRAGRLPGVDPFPGHSPFASQEPFPDQDPLSRQGPFPRQEPFPRPGWPPAQDTFPGPGTPNGHGQVSAQGPFPGPAPFPGENSLPGQDSFPTPEPFSNQDPSPRPAPASGQPFSGQPPFGGTVPLPAAAPEPGEDEVDARDPFPRGQRPDARPR